MNWLMAAFLEKKQALQKKVSGALRYPIIQLVIISIVVVFLLAFVVPKIAQIFVDAGSKLPFPTRVVLAASNFLQDHYILLPLMIAAITSAFLYWKSTLTGAKTLDKIKFFNNFKDCIWVNCCCTICK